jgi:hypothetical protein
MIPIPGAIERPAPSAAAPANPGVAGWCVLAAALAIEQFVELPADASAWWGIVAAGGWLGWAASLRWFHRRQPSARSARWRLTTAIAVGLLGFTPAVAWSTTAAAWSLPSLTGGEGASPEGILLAVLRGMLVAGIALGTTGSQTTFVIAATVFVVTLAAVVVDHPAAGAAEAAYALAAGCWLASRGPAATGRVRLPSRVGLAAAVAVAATVALLAGGHDTTGRAIAGWLPFSGGDSWAFPWARDGVGDGENLVAAREKPQATGPVDSNMFLTSHQPSLFDMFDDRYGEPLTKRNNQRQRAIALDVKQSQVTGSDEHFADSEHAGREFSTVRRAGRRRRPASNIAARAVVSVRGPAPVHLRLEVFEAFDGRSWRSDPPVAGPSALEHAGGDWMRWADRSPVTDTAEPGARDRHEVTIGTLRTPALPLPTLPARLRIDRIDRADFFRTPAAEVVTLDGVDVPAGTSVHVESVAQGIDAGGWPAWAPAHGARADVPAWVVGVAAAWGLPTGPVAPPDFSVAARIVAELAGRCTLDPDALPPPDCADTLRHFLTETRRGPPYAFAGAATLLLRACGYQARLAGGLHVSGERRDIRSRRLVASEEDAHLWAEVADAGGRWIPVEATPGIRLRQPALSWWRRVGGGVGRLVTVPNAAAVAVALAVAAIVFVIGLAWRRLVDAVITAVWRITVTGRRGCPLVATWRLVEWRAWLAGCPRPAHETARAWYVEACSGVDATSSSAAGGFIGALERAVYGPPQRCRDRAHHLLIARNAAAALTVAALRVAHPGPTVPRTVRRYRAMAAQRAGLRRSTLPQPAPPIGVSA